MKHYLIDPCYIKTCLEHVDLSVCKPIKTQGDGLIVIKVGNKVMGTVPVDSGMLLLIPESQIKEAEAAKTIGKSGLELEIEGTETIETSSLVDWEIADIELEPEQTIASIYDLPGEVSDSFDLLADNTTVRFSFKGVEYPIYCAYDQAQVVGPMAFFKAIEEHYNTNIQTGDIMVTPDID